MDVLTLRLRLEALGEKPPTVWTRAQLLARLEEVEGPTFMEKKEKTVSPLRQAEIELNKMARKKSLLQEHVRDKWNIPISGNETIDQLKVLGMKAAVKALPGHPTDHVGFGKHSDMTYIQVLTEHPDYCRWVVQTVQEGSTCDRCRRLGMWLMTPEAQEQTVEIKPEEKNKKTTRMTPKKNSFASGYMTSKDPSPSVAMMANLQKAVENLTQQVQEIKDGKEVRRKVTEGGATSSEWEPMDP